MAKNELKEMFNRKGEERAKGKAELIPLLFKAMGDAHISHLLQKDRTLARHNAFSDFYTAVDGQIDTFTETYMGMFPLSSITIPACGVIEDPVKYFTNLYKEVTAVRNTVKEGYLLNQIDEIHQLIAHTLYKFKYIKT